MPSQPPALRAANRAFHKKEESKMGKKPKPKPKAEEAEPEQPQQPQPVRRRKGKSARESTVGKWGLGVLIFIIFGGAVVQFLYMLNSN